ncbi:hypothetical protein [Hymenobacter sp. BT730]|uniref:hypothetical protein n=1 Tax=Hymenobacter sp. BT730 TaxID=3063332 RepID=UPI0026DFF7DF|nr:hypothetical protein [Hymenobacter sp. BT730]
MDYTLPIWLRETGVIIYWICQVALLYPLWVAWRRRDYWTLPVQILFWVLVALEVNCFFLDLFNLLDNSAEFRARFPPYGISTWPFVHVQINLWGLGYIAMFYYALQSPKIRQVLRIWVPVLLIISLLDSFYLHPFVDFKADQYAQTSQFITVIVLCVLYFEQLLQQLRISQVERDPLFWIATASILYFTSSLVMGSLTNKMLADTHYTNGRNFQALFGLISSSACLLSYVLLTIGFYQLGREQKLVLQ